MAATFHLEPNHNPTAGQSTLIWFALTRRGGALIPLQNCQCQLKIYRLPSPSGSPPLLQPSLQAITAEVYQGIPGAEVIFPQIGRYRLELSGSPIIPEAFQPFTLNYEVTVTQASQGSQP
ncbi:MAG: hypothetical protein NW237_17140 [Cyanobacteriota bacterium]|nr:hypothetical protein [Cyanobacteriota bacterium]